MQKPTIAIIGPGRAGSALARALAAAGYHIAAVYGRHLDSAQSLAWDVTARPVDSAAAAIALADLAVLAVPDDQIGTVAAEAAGATASSQGKAAVHLSGAQDRVPLLPLARMGVSTGVFHPLQTFQKTAQATANVSGSLFGIDAEAPLRDTLSRMATDLGARPFDLVGVDRALYHAAAVLVANYAVTLLAEATAIMARAGVPEHLARQGLARLLEGTVANIQRAPAARDALTGPASRGDEQTIQRHLAALDTDPSLQAIYRLLAERTRNLALREAS